MSEGLYPATVTQRFWAKVQKSDGCWEWTGALDHDGYGIFHVRVGISDLRAHRLAWLINAGPIPPGVLVLHRCDNRKCVRPEHLFPGSHADNMADKASKGRQSRGESHGCAKLKAADVTEMRDLYAAGGWSQRALARRYGVTQGTVGCALLRKNWRNVP